METEFDNLFKDIQDSLNEKLDNEMIELGNRKKETEKNLNYK